MQPIHLAIGIVEGFVTAAVVVFVWKARPEILEGTCVSSPAKASSLGRVLAALIIAAAVTGGHLLVCFDPPGRPGMVHFPSGGKGEVEPPKKTFYGWLAGLQEKTAFCLTTVSGNRKRESLPETRACRRPGTSLSGLLGGTLTLITLVLIGVLLKRRKKHHVRH